MDICAPIAARFRPAQANIERKKAPKPTSLVKEHMGVNTSLEEFSPCQSQKEENLPEAGNVAPGRQCRGLQCTHKHP